MCWVSERSLKPIDKYEFNKFNFGIGGWGRYIGVRVIRMTPNNICLSKKNFELNFLYIKYI